MRDGDRVLRLGGAKQRSVLAILLLRAGDIVSSDGLIDLLWPDERPEDAATALQQHVSRLRRALASHDVVRTRPPGYVAEIDDEQLDVRRFDALCAKGRRQLADGEATAAAATLRQALALWRGRPLGDLELEPFAAEAVMRLDEAWIEAVELRVEADLALGRHQELSGELRTLVRRHPLRERLTAQLMLALYRSGRQSDALDAYADARRHLAEELGLEPGPELRRLQQAILEQDTSLELERPGRLPARRTTPRLATAAVIAVAAVGAALLLGRGDHTPPAIADGSGAIVALDAKTGAIARRIAVGRTPAALAALGAGRVWSVDAEARTLLAVDPNTGDVATLATGGTPTEVALGDGAVWVGNGRPQASAQYVGPVVNEVVRVAAVTRTAQATIRLPTRPGPVSNAVENRLAATDAAVWAVTPAGGIARIDTTTSEVTAERPGIGAIAVAAGDAGVWALRPDGRLLRLDERDASVLVRVRLPTQAPTAIAVGGGAVWASSAVDATLWRITGDGQVGAVEVGSGVTDIAAAAGSTWVANPVAGTLIRVDPATMRVVRTVRVHGIPRAVAIHDGTLWAAVGGEAPPVTTEVSGLRALPAPPCEPLVAGGPRADVLIVSDLPLQGGIRVSALQMVQAITFVLREQEFRAGRFRVAYQSCDDSVARTGLFDEAKCAANARAYGRNEDVVAVIGTLNSPCALAAVPELNRAPGGPLAMVSPLNSFPGLTRRAVGVPATLLGELYPTGRRNYLRVFPTDDLQGAALAQLARERGPERVFVLDDGEPGYGRVMAHGFRTAARRLGLEVGGSASWRPQARSYAELAQRVAASGADAVFVGGLLDTNAAEVIRAVRTAAGSDVDVMGPDGLTPLPLLQRRAGRAARGVFVSLAGVVTESLPPEGAAFVRRFARTQAGGVIEPSAVYAAQATDVVLDALARSDGTRASLLDQLFATEVRGGLLGDFGFDRRGDITESPVTVMRVARGGKGTKVASVEGGVIERVARPNADLVAPGG